MRKILESEQQSVIHNIGGIGMALNLVFVAKGSFIDGDTWGDGWYDEKLTHTGTFIYDFI